jgi:hypothetical protein
VIYDRGDKTDWLKVSPQSIEDKQLIIRFNFLRVDGTVIVEVYRDPAADFLEKRVIEKAGIYEYVAQTVEGYYVKIYAVDRGNLAQYEFSYELIPRTDSTSVNTPVPKAIPTITPSVTTSKIIPVPTVTPTITPSVTTSKSTPVPTTVTPTITPSPTPIVVLAATPTPAPPDTLTETPVPPSIDILLESDFQAIGDRYGVSSNLLRAIGIIESQDGRVPGSIEVRKVVDNKQLKILEKIARHTGRPISDFKGSATGTMGYMQFMPATFYYYAQDGNGDGVKDPLNPYDSVATAAYFLAQEIAKTQSVQAALKSYNSDPASYKEILKLYWKLESENKHTSK